MPEATPFPPLRRRSEHRPRTNPPRDAIRLSRPKPCGMVSPKPIPSDSARLSQAADKEMAPPKRKVFPPSSVRNAPPSVRRPGPALATFRTATTRPGPSVLRKKALARLKWTEPRVLLHVTGIRKSGPCQPENRGLSPVLRPQRASLRFPSCVGPVPRWRSSEQRPAAGAVCPTKKDAGPSEVD